jgi:tetratricopeptide (TPR) repeat protein
MALRTGTSRTRSRGCALLLAAILSLHCGFGDPLEEVRAFQMAGRHQEALEILRALIDEGDRDPEILYLYGASQRRVGQPGLALAALHEARRAEGWEVNAGIELAAAAHDARAWPTAIEAASAVIEREPDNAYAYALRAQARMEARTDYEGALLDIDRVIELEPDNVAMRLGRVGILLTLERTEEAGEILRQIEEIAKPEDFSADEHGGFCVARATFERESGRLDESTAAFEDCLEKHPLAPAVVGATVEHYDQLGNPGRGNEILTDLVEALPLEFVPRADLARRLHAMGSKERAYTLLLEGGELDHPLAAAYALSTLAELYADSGRFADAALVFGRVRKLEGDRGPQRVLAHAELLALAGENERALALAEELGDHIYRHLVFATVSFSKRDAKAALEHLERALVQWPDNAAAQYYAGRAAERLGNFPRAIDAYRNSIRAGADETDAGVRLAELHRAAGRYQEAYVAVNHHVRKHPDDVDAALLAVELSTRLEPKSLQASLEAVPGNAAWGRVAALLSEVTAKRAGADAAIELLRGDPRIDLEQPRDVAALEALVGHLKTAGRRAEALAMVERLVARHPEDARLRFVLSLASEGEASRRALGEALRLDPTLEAAVLARARADARAGDVEAAVASLEPFVKSSPELLLEIAALLSGAGRSEQAEVRLESLLWEKPHNADAAREIVRLRLERGAGGEPRTLELAQRGTRFGGGGAEAYDVLARVFEARGEQDRADAARGRAREGS